jgi:hypothetical protein
MTAPGPLPLVYRGAYCSWFSRSVPFWSRARTDATGAGKASPHLTKGRSAASNGATAAVLSTAVCVAAVSRCPQ